jgi:acyl dehydratase
MDQSHPVDPARPDSGATEAAANRAQHAAEAAAAARDTLDRLESDLDAIETAIEALESADELPEVDVAVGPAVAVEEHAAVWTDEAEGPLQSGAPRREEQSMGFALDKLGLWTEGPEFTVEADRTKAYAAATNDAIAAHVNGEVAPPVFAVVPIWDTMAGAMAGVVPPEIILLVVHGEQDMRFHKPIIPGMVLRSKAAPIGIHVKPNGTTVVVKVETSDQTGDLVVEQYMTSFFRGVSDGESGGDQAPDHKLTAETKAADPVATVTQTLDTDQTYRYAEASGDHMPIHLDDDVAKSVGLPGIIIHGLCTMAFTSVAAVQELCDGDSTKLRRLAVRFSRPVLPGQQITTQFWAAGVADGHPVFGYETRNGDGDVVIKDGLVEIAGS